MSASPANTRAQVDFMLANPGVYVCGDSRMPDAVIPIVSQEGKLYSVKLDEALHPGGFLDTLTVEGPYPMRMRPKPTGQ